MVGVMEGRNPLRPRDDVHVNDTALRALGPEDLPGPRTIPLDRRSLLGEAGCPPRFREKFCKSLNGHSYPGEAQ